jgi:hypothetical protein
MSSRPITQASSQPAGWPQSGSTLHGKEDVYIFFHGLFVFGHNDISAVCEVGTHSKTADHKFQLLVYEVEGNVPGLIHSFTPESYKKAGASIHVDIENPAAPGVRFFIPDFVQDADWRKVIDFELLYGQVLPKKKGVQRPKIFINNGLFVVIPTEHEFLLVTDELEPELVKDLGTISFLTVGATAQRTPDGYVSITTDDTLVRLQRREGKKLVLVFTNVCPQDECDPLASDFGEYYKMFRKPAGTKKFKLVKKPGSLSTKSSIAVTLSFFNNLFGEHGALFHLLSSQDAPCGSAGFGQGGGGTSQPPA